MPSASPITTYSECSSGVAAVLAEAGVVAQCGSPTWPCDGEHLESLCSAPSFLFLAAASTPHFRLEDRRLLLEDIACSYLYLIKVNASCLPFHYMPKVTEKQGSSATVSQSVERKHLVFRMPVISTEVPWKCPLCMLDQPVGKSNIIEVQGELHPVHFPLTE
ncbi:hypothetical protein IRJ41_014890 [Triplophysa rosa]|uniref:Uncharacterized protein n=1 Tax=Triplophysa rosa TaxID=992332 RepID=A0A9W7TCY8_TRIRA|nr:hypothetical protein IRJ41_014890 [Triplophysa rosa]